MKRIIVAIIVVITLYSFSIGYRIGSSIWDNYTPKPINSWEVTSL